MPFNSLTFAAVFLFGLFPHLTQYFYSGLAAPTTSSSRRKSAPSLHLISRKNLSELTSVARRKEFFIQLMAL